MDRPLPAPRRAIAAMPAYRPPLEGRRGLLRLDFNERTAPPHPDVLAALGRLSGEALAAYPEYGPYRARLARYLGVEPEQTLPVNATDEAIQTVMLTYLEPGRLLVLAEPTFAMFRVYATIAGGEVASVAYPRDLSFPEDAFLAALADERVAVAVLVDPNSPTGTPVPHAAIARIASARPGLPVLVDEAYGAFTGRTAIDLVRAHPNLIVSQTFSKAHGLAGLRIGHLVGHPDVIADLSKVRSPYSVNVAAMAAAEAIMALGREAEPGPYVEEALAARRGLAEGLLGRGISVRGGAANFVLVDLGERCAEVVAGLRARGILIRDRSGDPGLAGCARISTGTREEIARFFDALDGLG